MPTAGARIGRNRRGLWEIGLEEQFRWVLRPVPNKRSHGAQVGPDHFARSFGDSKRAGTNDPSEMTERVARTAVSLVLYGLALIRRLGALVRFMDIAVERRRFRVRREARGGFPAKAGCEHGGEHDER